MVKSTHVGRVQDQTEGKTVWLRFLIAPPFVVVGLWIHELVQAQSEPWLIVDNALERAIPFLPWTIWIYFSFFLFIAATLIRVDRHLFWCFVRSVILASIIGWGCVLLIPVSFDRPDPALIDHQLYRQIFTFLHEADPSHITFPSLHVAVTWICCLLLKNQPGRGRRIALGIAISLSTLFTKKHLISDVIGGIGLAWFSVWMIENNYFLFRRRGTQQAACVNEE